MSWWGYTAMSVALFVTLITALVTRKTRRKGYDTPPRPNVPRVTSRCVYCNRAALEFDEKAGKNYCTSCGKCNDAEDVVFND